MSEQKKIVRAVSLVEQKRSGLGHRVYTIHNIYESPEFTGSIFRADGKTLKSAVSNKVGRALEDVDRSFCSKVELYVIKSAD